MFTGTTSSLGSAVLGATGAHSVTSIVGSTSSLGSAGAIGSSSVTGSIAVTGMLPPAVGEVYISVGRML